MPQNDDANGFDIDAFLGRQSQPLSPFEPNGESAEVAN
jgi:hypothetical protein